MPSSIHRDADVIDRGGQGLGIRISESFPGDSEVQPGLKATSVSKQINLFTSIQFFKYGQFDKEIIDNRSIFLT